ncbi:MAG: ABC transporter permease [Clostridiales bacterium]|nr:ABC transporter permease [Clostridiales bacterium]
MIKKLNVIKIEKKIKKKQNPTKEVFMRLLRNKSAMVGIVLFTIITMMSLFAPLMVDYYEDCIEQNLVDRFLPPSPEHWFGTDAFGRDIFARILYGGRISITLGMVSTGISMVIGGTLGVIAGYYGKKPDEIIMRIMDSIMAIPGIIFALAIVAALGPEIKNLIIAVLVMQIPSFARITKSAVIGVANAEYIEAAKTYAASPFRIILRYVLPNSLGPVIVHASMSVATMIMAMAGLSFIGMGVQPPTPEWGLMLSEAKEYIRYMPGMMYYPGAAIIITALSLNLFGDGLRDALDPKLKD